jgi:hypothetical protein
MDDQSQHHLGLVLVVGAAIVFSISGLFIRLIGADAWTTIFWRGTFSCLAAMGN